jgi:hypothetical protein
MTSTTISAAAREGAAAPDLSLAGIDALLRHGRALRSEAAAELIASLARRLRHPFGASADGEDSAPLRLDRRAARGDGGEPFAREESWVKHDGRHAA